MNSLVNHINASYSEEQLKVTKEFKKDESVYQQGDPAVKYYRVVRGIVIIGSITEEGKMIFKSLIHEGEFFGDEVIGGLNTRLNFALAFSNEILIKLHQPRSKIYREWVKLSRYYVVKFNGGGSVLRDSKGIHFENKTENRINSEQTLI